MVVGVMVWSFLLMFSEYEIEFNPIFLRKCYWGVRFLLTICVFILKTELNYHNPNLQRQRFSYGSYTNRIY
jgi:hypothetical protein